MKGKAETLALRLRAEWPLSPSNTVDVVAWNADGNLHSRPAAVELDAGRGPPRVNAQANRLFGADQVRLYLLSDYEDKSVAAGSRRVSVRAPTRENLQTAFAEV